MSDNDTSTDDQSSAPATDSVKSAISKKLDTMMSASKCGKAIVSLYLVLFLLVLILIGNVIQSGTSVNKGVSWAMFAFSIILGMLALFTLIKGGKYRKFGLPVLSIMITIMNFIGMLMAKPDLSFSQLFTPHFANITFAIVSCLAAVFAG